MASGTITSWQIDREKVEAVIFIFLGSKITPDGDYNHEIKTQLILGRKARTKLLVLLLSHSVTKLILTLCNPMDCSTPGFPVLHQLLELTQIHVH